MLQQPVCQARALDHQHTSTFSGPRFVVFTLQPQCSLTRLDRYGQTIHPENADSSFYHQQAVMSDGRVTADAAVDLEGRGSDVRIRARSPDVEASTSELLDRPGLKGTDFYYAQLVMMPDRQAA